MDVHDQLAQITTLIRDAKAMPMSASCLVNRAEMLDALERLKAALPGDLDQADGLLADRDSVVAAAQARAEATRLMADADDYVDRKLAEFEVVLGRLGAQVGNGRQRLAARRQADLAGVQEATEAAGSAAPDATNREVVHGA